MPYLLLFFIFLSERITSSMDIPVSPGRLMINTSTPSFSAADIFSENPLQAPLSFVTRYFILYFLICSIFVSSENGPFRAMM